MVCGLPFGRLEFGIMAILLEPRVTKLGEDDGAALKTTTPIIMYISKQANFWSSACFGLLAATTIRSHIFVLTVSLIIKSPKSHHEPSGVTVDM